LTAERGPEKFGNHSCRLPGTLAGARIIRKRSARDYSGFLGDSGDSIQVAFAPGVIPVLFRLVPQRRAE
jgi:hypothetical protein